ncbi:hypothetical protein VSDG_09685 [Cytospora chrysosperma]|uniref:Ecp2 effector protein domain-containing protein n=1 Tax=Cytospora chrysosperma TaxID=252740 RepID=A0A423V943_CYTCH|nr:hypothetical protein VSDG_09685 [Valsa sordida]
MMFLKLLILFAAVVAAIPDALGGTTALEIRADEEWKYCGVFATCDRDGAKRLSDYIGSCTPTSKGGYGTEFEVEGIEYTDPLQNSSCVAIGCDLKTYAQVWIIAGEAITLTGIATQDTTENITKNCTQIAYWMNRIMNECCTDTSSKGVSGQYFLGDGTNIVVAHGDCKMSYPGDVPENDGQCLG